MIARQLVTCPECLGSGEETPSSACPVCRGDGVVRKPDDASGLSRKGPS